MLFGSRIAANVSLPVFVNDHTQPSRVELHAGRFRVISAANVPMYTRRSVSATVEVVVTERNACFSAPFTCMPACDAVAVPTIPALPVNRPVNVFAPATVCVVVDMIPPSEAVAFGTLKFTVPPVLATENAASLNVNAAVAA